LWKGFGPGACHVHHLRSDGHHPGAQAARLVRENVTIRGRHFVVGIGFALALIVLTVVIRLLPTYYIGLLTEALILGMFAMSLNLLLGSTGLPTLGHAAYFGVAGYTMAILSQRLMQSFWVIAPAGVVASLGIAAIFGLLALRTAGVYFMMITLALAQVLWGI